MCCSEPPHDKSTPQTSELTWPQTFLWSQSDQVSLGCAGTRVINGGLTSQHIRFKGSDTDPLVLDSTGHSHRSCFHSFMGQSQVQSTMGPPWTRLVLGHLTDAHSQIETWGLRRPGCCWRSTDIGERHCAGIWTCVGEEASAWMPGLKVYQCFSRDDQWSVLLTSSVSGLHVLLYWCICMHKCVGLYWYFGKNRSENKYWMLERISLYYTREERTQREDKNILKRGVRLNSRWVCMGGLDSKIMQVISHRLVII